MSWTPQPTGSTRVAAVIGDPIAHSLSPVLHNAAFRSSDLDWTYVALRVGADDGPAAVAAMRALGLAGMSVTMPHKHTVLEALDGLTPIAERLGSVNCVYRDGERLIGDNTDVAGVVWAITGHLGRTLEGTRVAVIGAGGAARAAIAAAAGAGAEEILVVNRTAERAAHAAALGDGRARPATVEELDGMDLVVNATSVGMLGGPSGDPTGGAQWSAPVVMDLIYHPAETAWLAAARQRGAIVCNGVPMLIGQAAAAFERWTGVTAPIADMVAAANSVGLS